MRLVAGDRLGPYEVGPLIGSGGMGEVYRARDPRLGRDVAIKVLRGEYFAESDRLRRFEQEARAAAALDHPNILVVHDVGAHDGQPFVVSELLEGETLREKIARGRLPARKAVEYASQIANGLAAAHAKGIVHRDLKPANIFVTQAGRLKILDFGLAKLVDAGDALAMATATTTTLTTRAGQIVGTTAYMSPEQIRGEQVDPRSDIFAFGSVLYEMLTGRRAFDRLTPIETMSATLSEEPPGLGEDSDLPPDILLTLRRCLEKDRNDRYQSARDLAFQLTLLTSGSSSRGNAPQLATPRSRLWGRVAAVALLGAIVIFAAYFAGTRSARPSLPVFQQLTFRRGDVASARFTPDGHTVVYGAGWDAKPIQLSSTRLDSADSRSLGLPDGDVLAISKSGELLISIGRRYSIGHIARGTLARLALDAQAPREVLTDVEQADWSPDGLRIAVVRSVGSHYRLEYPIGTVLYQTPGWIGDVRVSPDGSQIAFTDHPLYGDDRGAVCVIAAAGGSRRVLADGWSSLTGIDWSKDGSEIWFTAAEVGSAASLRAVDLSGGTRPILPTGNRLALQDVDATGRVLLTQSKYRARIGSIDLREGKEHDWSWLDGSIATDLSPDGSTLLFTEQNTGSRTPAYAVYMRKTDGSPATRIGEGSDALLSPDGKWVATIALGSPPAVRLLPTSVGDPVTLPRGALAGYDAVAWFPDGRRVLLAAREAGQRVRLWEQEVPRGQPKAVSADGLRIAISSRPISPDGRSVIALDESDRVWLLPLAGGQKPEVLHDFQSGDIPIRWSADGTSVYAYTRGELPCPIHRFSLVDRLKHPVVSLTPADPVGVRGLTAVHTTSDGRIVFYTYTQALSDLYLVSNLR